MAEWKNHLDNLDARATQSANKALDYYDGDQLKWLEALLDGCQSNQSDTIDTTATGIGGIKKWRERGVYPWYTNVTKKIIDRSALSYNKPPSRKVIVGEEENEQATADYNEILRRGEFEAVMDSADSVARLLKNVIVLAQSVEVVGQEDKMMFDVLHRGNCDVDYDFKNGTIRSLMYQSAGMSFKGNELYHFWTPEEVVDIELVDGQPTVASREEHGYGIIPAAILWDTHKPRAGFWPKEAWTELIRLNEGVNLFHTESKLGSRHQSFPTLYTNAQLPEGTVNAPDATVEIISNPGDNVFLEYRSPDINLDTFREWLSEFESDIAENWGVNLRVGGSGSADSGFKLVVEEIWNLETRNDRLKSATQFERDMYNVVLAISNDQTLGLPADSSLMVKFPKPSLPVNQLEEWTITKEQLAMDYIALEDAWRKEEPDITPEDIVERKEKIAAAKLNRVPTFSNVVDDGEQ